MKKRTIKYAGAMVILSLVTLMSCQTEDEDNSIDSTLLTGTWAVSGTDLTYSFSGTYGNYTVYEGEAEVESGFYSIPDAPARINGSYTFTDSEDFFATVNWEMHDVVFSSGNSTMTVTYYLENCFDKESCEGGAMVNEGEMVFTKQ